MSVNRELTAIFEQIADLMDILGEDRFRVNSYRRVARVIKDQARDIEALAQSSELDKLPGVGKASAAKIRQYLSDEKIDLHQDLLARVPTGLPPLLGVPGLGPKTIALVWKEGGVTSTEELSAAIDSGKLESLAGLGAKKLQQIAKGIKFMKQVGGYTPLGAAMPIAQAVIKQLKSIKAVKKITEAGSLRRRCETIGDLDLLVAANDPKPVIKAFTSLADVADILVAGDTKVSVRVHGGLQIDLRLVEEKCFGAALQYFTGSKNHNVKLRERAVQAGYKLNEYGLFKGEKSVAGRTEEEIYAQLKLATPPPEMREDRGEIELAEKGPLPKLIELADIRGDMHMHTTASDGRMSIEEMAETTAELGYDYIAIADHSVSSAIANGLSTKRLEAHIKAIRKVDKAMGEKFNVLASSEVDILADGKLDYPDGLLAQLDWVTASAHTAQRQPRNKATARIKRAMDNPYVNCIGHPTGRLIGQREAMDLDMEAIVEHAANTNTALEINASYHRLDLKDTHARLAAETGVMLMINTDAHHVDQLSQMTYGVATARRAMVTADHVLNTRPLKQLCAWRIGKLGDK